MEEWIKQVASSDATSLSVLPATLLLGFLASFTSCCTVPVIGAIAGYSGSLGGDGRKKAIWISALAFFIGTVVSLSLVGALTGLVSKAVIAGIGNYWKIAAGILTIFFGLSTLNWLPFKMPSVKFTTKEFGTGIFSALLFGLAIGGLSTACNACCNPLFPIVIGASFLKGGILWGALILAVFALGYSLPLAVAMVGIGLGMDKLSSVAKTLSVIMKYVAGFLLLGIGFYLLITI